MFYVNNTIIPQAHPIQVPLQLYIGGIMVSILSLRVVDRGFEPLSGQTNEYKIGIFFFSAKYAVLKSRLCYSVMETSFNSSRMILGEIHSA